MTTKKIDYKYNEEEIFKEVQNYINSTYSAHYAAGEIQPTEFIVDQQQSLDFLIGNMIKYAARFGKKEGKNKKDLLKAIHYAIITLYYLEKQEKEPT